MAEIQLQRRSRDTELASLGSLARVCVELLASVRPSLSRGGNWFFRDRILCVVTQPLPQPHSHRHSLSSLRLWLSTNMPRDNDDSMFSLHISDRQESSRWRPRSNIGQTAFSNHKCIWELSAVRAPRHRRIRNTETKHGTKLRPSNFRPKNGTGSLQQQPCREKIGHEQRSSHWFDTRRFRRREKPAIMRGYLVGGRKMLQQHYRKYRSQERNLLLFKLEEGQSPLSFIWNYVCGGFFNISTCKCGKAPPDKPSYS